MLVVMAVVRMMQVAVVQIVDVIAVADRGVPAGVAVFMLVAGMCVTGHGLFSFSLASGLGVRGNFAGMRQSVEDQVRDVLVGQPVEDVLPCPPARNQLGLVQHPQALRDRGKPVLIGAG